MISREQIIRLHILAKDAGLDTRKDRASYELLLTNVAGVTTSKDLAQAGFEDVMATLEDMADANGANVGTYWRDTVARRNSHGTTRMAWKIQQLHADYESLRGESDPHYELGGLADRISSGRTRDPAQLRPREAWSLIEALKGIIARLCPEPDVAASPVSPAAEPAPF